MNWSAVVVGFQKLDWIETSMLAKPLSERLVLNTPVVNHKL